MLRRIAPVLGFAVASVLSVCVVGCSASPGEDGTDLAEQAATSRASVVLHARDVWGRPLPERGRRVTASQAGRAITVSGSGDTLRLAVSSGAPVRVSVSSEDFEDATIELSFDRSRQLVVSSPAAGRAGVAMRRGKVEHEVWIGARHLWFSSEGRPARRGNRLSMLMDGEEAWASVHSELVKAKTQVLASTWWWESNFELVRPAATHATLSPTERRANTIMGILEASPATKRVLVNQFLSQDGPASGFTVDAALKAHGERTNDAFEYMGQANTTSGRFDFAIAPVSFTERLRAEEPALEGASFAFETKIASDAPTADVDLTEWPVALDVAHASWHQKFMVVDQTAFVGGMNLRRVDWDTSRHEVFDSRRMLFDATRADREAVAARDKKPDAGPRKDYMMRVEGPSAGTSSTSGGSRRAPPRSPTRGTRATSPSHSLAPSCPAASWPRSPRRCRSRSASTRSSSRGSTPFGRRRTTSSSRTSTSVCRS